MTSSGAVLGRHEATGGVVSHPFRQHHGVAEERGRQEDGETIVAIAIENVHFPQSYAQKQACRPEGEFDGVRAVRFHQGMIVVHLHEHDGEGGTAAFEFGDALPDLAAERRLIALCVRTSPERFQMVAVRAGGPPGARVEAGFPGLPVRGWAWSSRRAGVGGRRRGRFVMDREGPARRRAGCARSWVAGDRGFGADSRAQARGAIISRDSAADFGGKASRPPPTQRRRAKPPAGVPKS